MRKICLTIAQAIYRVKKMGVENIPKTGGVVLISNHVSYVDTIALQIACPRKIYYLVNEELYNKPFWKTLFHFFEAIPISSAADGTTGQVGLKATPGLRKAVTLLKAGEVVCLFPEGELTRNSILSRLKAGYYVLARRANVPVVPVWIDQLWGSLFSHESSPAFTKWWPKRLPYPVTVAFGKPIAPAAANPSMVRETLLGLGADSYEERAFLKVHLSRACLKGLKAHPFDVGLIDGLDKVQLKRGQLLAAGIVLSRYLKEKMPDQKRIGVILPPGKGGVIANLAIVLANKIPVNFNFTTDSTALQAAYRASEVKTVLTGGPMEQKLGPDFPWPEEKIYLEKLIPTLKPKMKRWWFLALLIPTTVLAKILGLPKEGGHKEAVLLFTSGSSGEPKGVVLSHRNILGNISQIKDLVVFRPGEVMLGSLPFFHSFGTTVTLWLPLITQLRIVTYPNPLDTLQNANLIETYKITILISTPTFLRSYIRKVEPYKLASLRLCIVGSEKLSLSAAAAFEKKFKMKVCEGYGLTETSPVVSANTPDLIVQHQDKTRIFTTYRLGSVGKLNPGLAIQIRDPNTGQKLSILNSGMLWLRGPNIFEGYLNDPVRTAETIQDGWLCTGDIGRCDEDGFLYIEGRISRFSKIGGEMVPHETIESKIQSALGLPEDSEKLVLVVGVPDEAKGEALVLLSLLEIDTQDLRLKLTEAGLPNLWIPRMVFKITTLPLTGSGKLDFKKCREMAESLRVAPLKMG